MRRFILCSLFALACAANAFGDDSVLLTNGQDIAGACDILHLGTYSGSVDLEPVFERDSYTCAPGYYLPADGVECVACLEDHYCVGSAASPDATNGKFAYDESVARGISDCPNSLYAPAGMSDANACGRILHVGDQIVYLRRDKKTTPAINVDVDNDGVVDFYGSLTAQDVPMHAGTQRSLKVRYNNTTYSVYDDTVTVPAQ